MSHSKKYILAIESSCDDTAAAVLENDVVLSNVAGIIAATDKDQDARRQRQKRDQAFKIGAVRQGQARQRVFGQAVGPALQDDGRRTELGHAGQDQVM